MGAWPLSRTQPDPIGYAGGANLYAYVDNDPLNFTDPSGEVPIAPWLVSAGYGAVAGGIAGLISARDRGFVAGAKGALAGVAAGALVGLALEPWLAAAVGRTAALAIVGGAAATGTQLGSNVLYSESLGQNFSVGAVAGAMAGGVGGAIVGRAIGNWAGGATSVTIGIGSGAKTLSYATAPTSRATANWVKSGFEGAVVGGLELGGHAIEDSMHLHSGSQSTSQNRK